MYWIEPIRNRLGQVYRKVVYGGCINGEVVISLSLVNGIFKLYHKIFEGYVARVTEEWGLMFTSLKY